MLCLVLADIMTAIASRNATENQDSGSGIIFSNKISADYYIIYTHWWKLRKSVGKERQLDTTIHDKSDGLVLHNSQCCDLTHSCHVVFGLLELK
jgi:hypothetical protein